MLSFFFLIFYFLQTKKRNNNFCFFLFQLVYCLTIGAFAGKPDNVVVGMTAALAWELPSEVDKKITKLLHRRTRSVIFPKIEALLQS